MKKILCILSMVCLLFSKICLAEPSPIVFPNDYRIGDIGLLDKLDLATVKKEFGDIKSVSVSNFSSLKLDFAEIDYYFNKQIVTIYVDNKIGLKTPRGVMIGGTLSDMLVSYGTPIMATSYGKDKTLYWYTKGIDKCFRFKVSNTTGLIEGIHMFINYKSFLIYIGAKK
jgi:hypothetical protein